jgi:hypothetical protein
VAVAVWIRAVELVVGVGVGVVVGVGVGAVVGAAVGVLPLELAPGELLPQATRAIAKKSVRIIRAVRLP